MEPKAEQYYPTYRSQERDILLLEFDEAQKIANGQAKVYGQVTNILLALITFSFTFLLNQDDQSVHKALVLAVSNAILFSVILFVFGGILLRYFVDLQKQITINARKVVTLRTLLGLDYGHINLTLPNWRVEGATNPFVIKYFNGWTNFKAMPFWLLTITVNLVWWFATEQREEITVCGFPVQWIWGHLLIVITYFWIFRSNLNDRHETTYLSLVKGLSFIFGIKLVDNFEYIIYRAKLSYVELDRLNFDYQNLIICLVEIEDKEFYCHFGVSLKSLVRGLLSRFAFLRKKYGYIEHGGSTITMQLTRSLFIPSNQNKYLRKISELLLSLWLSGQFSKAETLKLYVASVRYERSVLGLSSAVKYFFGKKKQEALTNEEAFFLVERLSNVTSTVNWDRINHLTKRTSISIDNVALRKVYNDQIKSGRLKK